MKKSELVEKLQKAIELWALESNRSMLDVAEELEITIDQYEELMNCEVVE